MKKTPFVLFALFVLITNTDAQTKITKKYIDPANMDLSVKPGDDFYRYVSGTWIKNNPIPASRTRWSSAVALAEISSSNIKSILEEDAKKPEADKISKILGDFYASGMDSIHIEELGFTPIKPELDRISKINSLSEIINEIATLRVRGIASPLFGFFIGTDSKNTNQYIAQFGQGGTTLPDRDYYIKKSPKNDNLKTAYKSFITDLFKLTGTDENTARENADAILTLETKIAEAQMSRVEMRDPIKLYNKFLIDDFSKTTTTINWKQLMAKMMVTGQDSILVSNPKFLRFADSLLPATPVTVWKTYLQWYILKNNAAYLSNAFVQRNFQFSKVLSGQKEITPRWQRMSSLIDGNLGELLGQQYVALHFKPEAKKRMIELVDNLQAAFAKRINGLDWMTTETKQKALQKLSTFKRKIGYPDKWKTYDGIVIKRNDYLGNIRSCNAWGYADRISKLGKPVDKTEWNFTPPTINASYSPTKNEITFPAGILQSPFFELDADDAINYGGIGAVIGHEMTHGFDDQGRKYDADGNLRDWWNEEDAKQFNLKADKIVAQYNDYTILDTVHVNGKLTLGENLADLGGLSIAYDAFKNTAQGKSTKKINGYTPDQRFFYSWAQIWRGSILPETAAQFIITDPHSPAQHRANGVLQNFTPFYQAFNISKEDKMYKEEKDRVKIW